MMWICDECRDKKALCHLSCEKFKIETGKSMERKRQIESALRRERDMNSFAFEVHRNGLKYERSRRKTDK